MEKHRHFVKLDDEVYASLNELKQKLNLTKNTKAITFAIAYLLRVIQQNEKNKKK